MKNFILLIILSLSIGVSGQCEKDRVLYDSLTFKNKSEWSYVKRSAYEYSEAHHKSDLFTGVAFKLNEKGSLKYEGWFYNGRQYGLSKTWHDNGQLSSYGHYDREKKYRLWKSWNENGELTSEAFYVLGEIEYSKEEYSLPSLEEILKKHNTEEATLIKAYVNQRWQITKADYKQFALWVRDSISHHLLGDNHLIESTNGKEINNWKRKIKWHDKVVKRSLQDMFWREALKKDYGNFKAYLASQEKKPPIINLRVLWYEYTDFSNNKITYWIDGWGNEYEKSTFRDMVEKYGYPISCKLPLFDLSYTCEDIDYDIRRKRYDDFWSEKGDESLIDISYEQAVAYYIWRNNQFMKSTKSKKQYQVNLITPSLEEWEVFKENKEPINAKIKSAKVFKLVPDLFYVE